MFIPRATNRVNATLWLTHLSIGVKQELQARFPLQHIVGSPSPQGDDDVRKVIVRNDRGLVVHNKYNRKTHRFTI